MQPGVESEFYIGCFNNTLSNVSISNILIGNGITSINTNYEVINVEDGFYDPSLTTSVSSPGIPSTTLGNWDSEIYTIWTPDMSPFISEEDFNSTISILIQESGFDDVQSLDFINYVRQKVISNEIYLPKRWEIYNTAIKKTASDNFGFLAYHECKNATYQKPINSDCILDYWGEDACGNSLQGQPIRHHRLPDRKIEPVSNTEDLNILGLEFNNVEYPPNSNIVSHYFVYSNDEKTIIDKGYTGYVRKGIDETNNTIINGFSYFYGNPVNGDEGFDKNNYYYLSPATLLNKVDPKGYIKNIGCYNNITKPIPTNKSGGYSIENTWGGGDLELFHRFWKLNNYDPKTNYYNTIYNSEENFSALGDKILDNNYKLYNLSWAMRMRFFTNTAQQSNCPISYISIKQNKDIYCNLDSIEYKRLHNCNFTEKENQVIYGGDVYIQAPSIPNYVLCKLDNETTSILYAGIIAAIGVLLAPLTFGASIGVSAVIVAGAVLAVGITATIAVDIIESSSNEKFKNLCEENEFGPQDGIPFIGGVDGFVNFNSELLYGGYIETYYDWNLLLKGNDTCYDPFILDIETTDNDSNLFESFSLYVKDKLLTTLESDITKEVMRSPPCPIAYLYNDDYTPISKPYIAKFPLPSIYNCCSDCLEEFPTRIYHSQQSFQNDLTDNYRVFLPNDFVDIQSEHGEITNLIREGNNLYVQTSEALFYQPQNVQERVTGDIVSFIGTGDYFSIPPRMILDSENGTVGSQDKWSTVRTPYGIFIVDEIDTKIYLVQNKSIQELSRPDLGFDLWFKKNLKRKLYNKYTDKCNSYLRSTYDSCTKQILLTKIDYLPINENIVYNKELNKYFIEDKEVDLNDDRYFCDCSWTLSYSFRDQGWGSFYSFTPYSYISGKNVLFGLNNNSNAIWKFYKKGHYQTFFGEYFPHIIEEVHKNKPTNTNIASYIRYNSKSKEYKLDVDEFFDVLEKTYNKLIIYNDRQISGELELVFKNKQVNNQNIPINNNQAYVSKVERNYYINEFRDFCIDPNNTLFNNVCIDYRFSNKILNEDNIDFNKPWHKQERFNDKYLIVRLIFDKFDNIKIIYDYQILFEQELIKN